ncbi:MAG: helix-turn-helix domain-containing protein [Trueperaceae bacterium]|nr:helix-turn-helix domain-containing protein [Trueperaceae bacterium]MCC6311926.1 helix-turn-helix domain-containing protein [Trueperaceae bacterium]MCO5172598.1 MarR family transcriptional regulator [Trueperaceae bacterium]MCW5819145.1 helix-turn-helix domain-containing protein [Trueperaceae bacterium]
MNQTDTRRIPTNRHLSEARWRLLGQVLRHRDRGQTVEELAEALSVSRNAVQQHVTSLERDGLLRVLGHRTTGGRPGRAFTLTEAALELFPRSYAKLADDMLRNVRELFGESGLDQMLVKMADEVANELEPRLAGKQGGERIAEVAAILHELGYEASVDEGGRLLAANCVFHRLAHSSQAVCRYDHVLLRRLLGDEVDQLACITDGSAACVFTLR